MATASVTAPALTIFYFLVRILALPPTHSFFFCLGFHLFVCLTCLNCDRFLCSPAHLCQMLFPTGFFNADRAPSSGFPVSFTCMLSTRTIPRRDAFSAMPALVRRFDNYRHHIL